MTFLTPIKNSSKKSCSDAGFTMIEVLIAMFIFAIGILGLTKMQIVSINGNNLAGRYTEGSTWGASRIETIMANAYDAVALNGGTTGDITEDGMYRVQWTITDSVPIPNVKQISMTVRWNLKDQAKSFTTNYYKAVTY